MLVASKSPKRSLDGRGDAHGCAARAHLTGTLPCARPGSRQDEPEPRSGDFVRQSLGVQGAAAIGHPARCPAPVTLYGITH
ncbi:hypothetical protein ACLK1V_16900 [Escherichia coli]